MTSTRRRPLVAVFGSSTVREGEASYRLAHDLGRALAAGGADVMTGGYGGAMEACSQGAHEAGGHVIGVTVELFEHRGGPNPWVRERVHTADLFDRLREIVMRADGFAALPGSIGTLTEVFLAWTLLSVKGRPSAPLVLVGAHWDAWLEAQRGPELVLEHLFQHVRVAHTAEDAARRVLDAIAATRGAA